MPKLQKQLRIRLHRLPLFVLRSALSAPESPRCLDHCSARSHPKFAPPVTRPALSHSITLRPPEPPSPAPRPASRTPLPNPVTKKSLQLRLHRLPQTVVRSGLRLRPSVSPAPLSAPHPSALVPQTLTHDSAQACFQGRRRSELQDLDALTENCGVENRAGSDVYVHAQPNDLDARAEQDDDAPDGPEEEEAEPVNETVPTHETRTDPHYVLRPQNSAECGSLSSLAGLANGFPQKGPLQNKHKIRVDFKVGFST